jgi:hypothetical protein
VTPVILLILVVLWVAVLAPGFLKKRAERRSVDSIDSFHHQLHLLEQQSGPKIVDPAYRLEAAGGLTTGPTGLPAITSMPGRPKLRLLGASGGTSGTTGAVDYGDPAASQEASGTTFIGESLERTSLSTFGSLRSSDDRPARHRPDTYQRRQALKRRRDIFGGLVATFFLTALLGMVHSFRILWAVTVLSGLALAAYVVLMAYARQMKGQATSGLSRAMPRASRRPPHVSASALRTVSPATAASPRVAGSRRPEGFDDTAEFAVYQPREAFAR